MREIRQSGLEGGETNMLGLPYPIDDAPPQRIWLQPFHYFLPPSRISENSPALSANERTGMS